MKTHKHTIPYTITVELELEIEVTGTITPGDPGYRYTRNGDGWPPTGSEVDILEVKLKTPVQEIEENCFDILNAGGWEFRGAERLLLSEAVLADEAAKEASDEARAEMRRERMEDR